MKIQTKELREFLGRARNIKTNIISPALSYIKYEYGTLTKSNLETYYSKQVSSDGNFAVLLDEKILSSFMSANPSAEEIDITANGLDVTLHIGNKTVSFQSVDASAFPIMPDSGKSAIERIEADFLRMIGTAAQLTADQQMLHNLSFVHVTSLGIYASDGSCFMHYDKTTPSDMLLSKEAADIVSDFDWLDHTTSGNYDLFANDSEIFAFIKPHFSTPIDSFNRVIRQANADNFFEIDKKDVIQFLDFTASITSAKSPNFSMKTDSSQLRLALDDTEFSIKADDETAIVAGDFRFNEAQYINPKTWSSFLKAIPFNSVRVSPYNSKGFVTVTSAEDESFKAIMPLLVNLSSN
jgi:hypothetical protein